MNLVNHEFRRLGECGWLSLPCQAEEAVLLAGKQRIAPGDERREFWLAAEDSDGTCESGHVVVFPDRHMLVEIADERLPPSNHPPAGLAKQWQAFALFDQRFILGSLVTFDENLPLAINLCGLLVFRRACRQA